MDYDIDDTGIEERDWTSLREADIEGGPVRGRGEVLSVRGEDVHCHEERWIRRRPLMMAAFYALVASMVIVPITVPLDLDDVDSFMAMAIFASAVPTFIMVLGLSLLRPRMVSETVYENGVAVRDHKGRERYIPWGYFFNSGELDNAKGTRLILMGTRAIVVIPSGMPGYDGWHRDIEKRVGKEDYMVLGPEDAKAKKAEYAQFVRWILLTSIIGSTIVAFTVYMTFYYGEGDLDLQIIAMLYLIVAMFVVPMVAGAVLKVRAQRYYGHDIRKAGTVLVVIGLISYSLFTVGFLSMDFRSDPYDLLVVETPEPLDSVLEAGTYVGEDIIADGPVKVEAGEQLVLSNSTVTFDRSPGLEGGLWVGRGGTLIMDNCTVTSSDVFKGFYIKVHGIAHITDTDIIGLADNEEGYDSELGGWAYEYGFEVTHDGFSLVDSRVIDSLGTALLINECEAQVTGCTFYRAGASGMVLRRTAPRIDDTTFEGCERGLNIYSSNATVDNCTFRSNEDGVVLRSSGGSIANCTFIDNRVSAIEMLGSDPELSDNERIGTGNGILDLPLDYYEYDDTFMVAMMVYMGPVMVLFMSLSELVGERIKLRNERKAKADNASI